MIVLKHGKFISGAKIFSAGAILPDNANTGILIEQGLAEIIAETPKKPVRAAQKNKVAITPDELAPELENAQDIS